MITVFQNGDQGSRQTMMDALNSVRDQGTAVLNAIEAAYTTNLVNLERRLTSINARRQLANRVPTLRSLGKLVVTDFNDIDQAKTTATVRIDSQSVTLRERSQPAPADVKSTVFSTNLGSVETMGALYQVNITDGSGNSPTGTFNISLFQPLAITMLVFDISATPSRPEIVVQVSTDGITFVNAVTTNLSGYRVSAYFPSPMEVNYIQIAITPSHPDDLGGTTFTFGITDFSSASVQFQLLSELTSRTIQIAPASSSLLFVADADPGISFFLSIAGQPFVEVVSGGIVQIPGASDVSAAAVAFEPSPVTAALYVDTGSGAPLLVHTGTSAPPGMLATFLPLNMYPASLNVTDASSGATIPMAPGLAPGSTGFSTQYMAVNNRFGNGNLYLTPYTTADAGRTFNVTYTCGPATVPVILRAQIITEDRAATPVFRGASFQEV